MPTIYKDIEIEIDLDDFSNDDLVEELESRGIMGRVSNMMVRRIYEKRRLGQDYQQDLDKLINEAIGRVI